MREFLCVLVSMLCLLVVSKAQAHGIKGCFGDTGSGVGDIRFVMAQGKPLTDTGWPCRDEDCRARRDLACVANAQAHRLQPDTMGYNTRADAERRWIGYGRVIRTLGRTHPNRIPRYCTLLAQVARTVTADEPPFGTARNVVELAIQLDRPGNGCLQGVMAALPDVDAVKDFRQWGTACLHTIRLCQRDLYRGTLE